MGFIGGTIFLVVSEGGDTRKLHLSTPPLRGWSPLALRPPPKGFEEEPRKGRTRPDLPVWSTSIIWSPPTYHFWRSPHPLHSHIQSTYGARVRFAHGFSGLNSNGSLSNSLFRFGRFPSWECEINSRVGPGGDPFGGTPSPLHHDTSSLTLSLIIFNQVFIFKNIRFYFLIIK